MAKGLLGTGDIGDQVKALGTKVEAMTTDLGGELRNTAGALGRIETQNDTIIALLTRIANAVEGGQDPIVTETVLHALAGDMVRQDPSSAVHVQATVEPQSSGSTLGVPSSADM